MIRRTLLAVPALVLGLALPAAAQSHHLCGDTWTYDVLGQRWIRIPCAHGPTATPEPAPARGPRAWQPAPAPRTCEAPRPCPLPRPTVTPRPASCSDDIPMAEPLPRGPAAWRTPTRRVVPRAWRDPLPAERLSAAHERVRAARDAACRLAIIDEIARAYAVTVDQVVVLVAALPTSSERLEALTRLHGALGDRRGFGRTYALLSPEDQEVLHVRITLPFDGETARRRARLRQLMEEERELQRVLGDR